MVPKIKSMVFVRDFVEFYEKYMTIDEIRKINEYLISQLSPSHPALSTLQENIKSPQFLSLFESLAEDSIYDYLDTDDEEITTILEARKDYWFLHSAEDEDGFYIYRLDFDERK